MKILDKVWNILGLVEADEPESAPPNQVERSVSRSDRKTERPVREIEESKPRKNPQPDVPKLPPVVADKPATVTAGCKATLVISQPMGFDDARQIAENVTNGRTVFVNFDRTDAETTKRTVDFMSGITYAVGGSVQRISGSIFLFAPATVEITSSDQIMNDIPGTLPWNRS